MKQNLSEDQSTRFDKFIIELGKLSTRFGILIKLSTSAIWVLKENEYQGFRIHYKTNNSSSKKRDITYVTTWNEEELLELDESERNFRVLLNKSAIVCDTIEEALITHAELSDARNEPYFIVVIRKDQFALVQAPEAKKFFMEFDFAILDVLSGKLAGSKNPFIRSYYPSTD